MEGRGSKSTTINRRGPYATRLSLSLIKPWNMPADGIVIIFPHFHVAVQYLRLIFAKFSTNSDVSSFVSTERLYHLCKVLISRRAY